MIDLHIHTTASDGSLTPKELIEYAKHKGLSAIAITDHNTLGNVEECVFLGKQIGLEVIPGVEISAETNPELHILAYFFDERYFKMQSWFSSFEHRRNVAVPLKIIGILNQLGYKKITVKYVASLAQDGILQVHFILDALVKKRYFKTRHDAYQSLFAPGQAAYVPTRPLPEEIFQIVREHGGICVLAHPFRHEYSEEELYDLLVDLKQKGLNGIEIYHSDMPKALIPQYESMAQKLGLLVSGGSDFHGKLKPSIEIGVGHGDLSVDDKILEMLKAF